MNEKAQALKAQVEDRIVALAELTDAAGADEQMQTFLATMSRFHQYSVNNVFLILIQRPDATQVAGFRKWKEFKRHVRKGEKGIAILAPVTVKVENEDGEAHYQVVNFKVVYVFDVAQTEGEPLPEMPDWKSPEKSEELQAALLAYADELEIGVEVKAGLVGGAQGMSKGGAIELDETAGTKTLIHELVHELLKHRKSYVSKVDRETEAEAAAYVVGQHFGLGGGNCPNYLFLSGADGEKIMERMSNIQAVASKIITAVEGINGKEG